MIVALRVALMASLIGASAAQALNPADLDPKTPACSDFYEYANGGWLRTTPVPPERESWGTFDQLIERNLQQQQAMIDAIIASPQDSLDQLIADFFLSGRDEAGVNAAGYAAAAPMLAEIDQLKRLKDIPLLLAKWHARGLPLLFQLEASADLKAPDQIIAYVTQGGLILPDRDYYLREEPEAREVLGIYRSYLQKLLALSGGQQAELDSGRALGFEMRLAAASLSLVQLRDPSNSYRPVDATSLRGSHPQMQWKGFFKAQQLGGIKALSFPHPTFFNEVERQLTTGSLDEWKAYLKVQLLDALAPYLSAGFVAAHDELHRGLLRGELRPPTRSDRVRRAADLALGDALGQRYVERYLPEARRLAAVQVVEDIRSALRLELARAPWLEDAGRTAAVAKLDALTLQIGKPASWRSYEGLSFDRGNYAGNVMAAAAFAHRQDMSSIGEKRRESLFPVPPQSVNGYYAPNHNTLVLTAGLLQPPLLDPEVDIAQNYGALGALVGHELVQGYDVVGQLFDGSGSLISGWQPNERDAFLARTAPLEAQYNEYTAVGSIKVDGRLTRSKNVADLGGLELAWRAFAQRQSDVVLPQIEGHSPAQRFFLSWAALWRRNELPDALIRRQSVSVHAPPRHRVNGPLLNLPAFSDAFGCSATQPMRRSADQQVHIWSDGAEAAEPAAAVDEAPSTEPATTPPTD